jgi:oligoribonuclease
MKLTSDAKAILWVDLETTGTDETEDDIIEVGAILTDFDLEVIRMFSAVSRPSDHAYKRMMENKVVRKMHTDNGLLAILDKLPPDFGDLRKVDADFVKFIREWVPEGKVYLAGSGVSHFDKRFIQSQLWETDALLVRPTIDVGVIRRFFRISGITLSQGPPGRDKTHRAMDDITQHLNEARHFRNLIVGMNRD